MNMLVGAIVAAVSAFTPAAVPNKATGDAVVLDHEATLSDGKSVVLEDAYAGKVVLIVNTASRCGFTRQYDGLQELYEAHKDEGFTVLAFPCNDFGAQEPGGIDDIVEFCRANYGVTFPVFDKVRVLGDEAHPLFVDLRNQPEPIGGPPRWNFTKFLINRRGEVSARFEPGDEPGGDKVVSAV
ncbi:MAG: glutathione peroxidase, partial [Planctomycetota bacterium]